MAALRLNHRWRSAAVVVLAGVAILALAGRAAAHSFSADFSVQGTNGYRISVSALDHAVRVLVTKGRVKIGEHVIETEYGGPAGASPAGIEADLGPLGAISLQFHPTAKGRVFASPKDCWPRKVYRRPGTFTGSFSFVGEGSYTSFEATELQGSVGAPDDLICGWFSQIDGRRPPIPYATARTSNDSAAAGFLGFDVRTRIADPRHAYLTAESRETLADLSVRRYITEIAPISNFWIAPDLRKAVVSPPAPFSGSATFERKAKGEPPELSGSLSVSFPGKPEVPLTGEGFKLVELGEVRLP